MELRTFAMILRSSPDGLHAVVRGRTLDCCQLVPFDQYMFSMASFSGTASHDVGYEMAILIEGFPVTLSQIENPQLEALSVSTGSASIKTEVLQAHASIQFRTWQNRRVAIARSACKSFGNVNKPDAQSSTSLLAARLSAANLSLVQGFILLTHLDLERGRRRFHSFSPLVATSVTSASGCSQFAFQELLGHHSL
jgi:hypothetical protein